MKHDNALNVGHVWMDEIVVDNHTIFSSKFPEPCFILHSVVNLKFVSWFKKKKKKQVNVTQSEIKSCTACQYFYFIFITSMLKWNKSTKIEILILESF